MNHHQSPLGHSYELNKPIWMVIKEEKPLRDQAVANRIEHLLEQRSAIDLEIEMLRQESQIKPLVVDQWWGASLIGFHNPVKHTGLSPEAFLTLYRKSLEKKKTDYHKKLLANAKSHHDELVAYISQKLRHTLQVTNS